MPHLLGQLAKAVMGLVPVADALAGTVVSDAVRLNLFQRLTAFIIKGAGATGTSTITVEACTIADGTGAEAIPFKYYSNLDTAAADSQGSVNQATAAGFATTAGANQLYQIEVDVKDLPADKPFVRIKCVEVANDPVTAAILLLLHEPKHARASMPTVIS